MSSPSVPFVFERLLCGGRLAPGRKGLIPSFGASVSDCAALVDFRRRSFP
jgi:3-oxoacyl-[acyl-carrier-protein] synthase III